MNDVRIAAPDLHPAERLVGLPQTLLPAEGVEEGGVAHGVGGQALVAHIVEKIESGGELALAAEGLHEDAVG